MHILDSTPNMAPITDLILTWTHVGQALVRSSRSKSCWTESRAASAKGVNRQGSTGG